MEKSVRSKNRLRAATFLKLRVTDVIFFLKPKDFNCDKIKRTRTRKKHTLKWVSFRRPLNTSQKYTCSSETTIRAHLSGLSLKLLRVKSWIKSNRGSLLSPMVTLQMTSLHWNSKLYRLYVSILSLNWFEIGFLLKIFSSDISWEVKLSKSKTTTKQSKRPHFDYFPLTIRPSRYYRR